MPFIFSNVNAGVPINICKQEKINRVLHFPGFKLSSFSPKSPYGHITYMDSNLILKCSLKCGIANYVTRIARSENHHIKVNIIQLPS